MDKKHKKKNLFILCEMSKTAKNAQVKQITSLDEKHQEMLEKFNNNLTQHIPKLKKERRGSRICQGNKKDFVTLFFLHAYCLR